jgi:hypothetical protein
VEKTDQVSTIPPHPKEACADESNAYHRPWYGTDGNEWLKFVKCYIFTGKLKNCMNSVDFGTVWTVWILFCNCMDSVNFVLELHGQCGFCFVTVWTVWILLWNCMDSVDFVLYSYKTKSTLFIQFQNKIHTVHTVPKLNSIER